MATFSKIKFGDGLSVVDEGSGVITVNSSSGIGPQGPPGPPGPAGGGASFVFTQSTLSATWVIAHNLGLYPSVTVVDTGDSEIIPTLHYDSSNQVTVTFAAPTSGKAFLN